jgi:hypothetical protein
MIKDSTIIHFDKSRACEFVAENSCFEFHAGIKVEVPLSSFDLCGKEPSNNMDIYITQKGKFSCDGANAQYRFVGNVKLYDFRRTPWGDAWYSIYIVSEPEKIESKNYRR